MYENQSKGDQIRRLLSEGKEAKEIAERLNIPMQRVYNERHKLKLSSKQRPATATTAATPEENNSIKESTQTNASDREKQSSSIQADDESRKRRSAAFELFKQGCKDLDVAVKLGLSDSETADYKRQYLVITGRHELASLYELEPERVKAVIELERKMDEEKMDPLLCIEAMKNRRLVDCTNRKFEEANQHLKIKQQEIEVAESTKVQLLRECDELKSQNDQMDSRLKDLEERLHLKRSEYANESKAAAEAEDNQERMKRACLNKGCELFDKIKESVEKPEIDDRVLSIMQELIVNPEIENLFECSQLTKRLEEIPEEIRLDVLNARYMFLYELANGVKSIVISAIEYNLRQPQTSSEIANQTSASVASQ